MSIRIVLADDHHIMRQGLRLVLEAQEDFQVVAEAGNGLDTLTLVERLTPCVLIVDVMMPGLNGLEVTRQVRQRAPRTRVIVLSMYSNEAYVLEALRHGATGYVLKEAHANDLVHAVREVVAGRRYLAVLPLIAPELTGRLDLATQLWNGIVSYCLVYGPGLAAYVIWMRPGMLDRWWRTDDREVT